MSYRIYSQPHGAEPHKYIINSRAVTANAALGGSAKSQMYKTERSAAHAAARLSARLGVLLHAEKYTSKTDTDLVEILRPHTPPRGLEYLEPACAGDAAAASSLIAAAENKERGVLAALYCDWGTMPNSAQQAALSVAWEKSHGLFCSACDELRINYKDLIYYSNFFAPKRLPDTFKAYRGICLQPNETLDTSDPGLSWTTDKETAKWFANRFKAAGCISILLSIEAEKNHIVYYSNAKNEEEVLLYPALDADKLEITYL